MIHPLKPNPNYILIIVLFAVSSFCLGQGLKGKPNKKIITPDEFIVRLITGKDTLKLDSTFTVEIDYLTYPDQGRDSLIKAGFKTDSSGRLIISKAVNIKFPKFLNHPNIHGFTGGENWVVFRNLHFVNSVSIKLKGNTNFVNCIFDDVFILECNKTYVSVNHFFQGFSLTMKDVSTLTENIFSLQENYKSFDKISDLTWSHPPSTKFWKVYYDTAKHNDGNLILNKTPNEIVCENCKSFSMPDNSFRFESHRIPIRIEVKSDFLYFEGNKGNGGLIFEHASKIEKGFKFTDNSIAGFISLEDMIIPEESNIEWSSLKDNLSIVCFKPIRVNYSKIPKDDKKYTDTTRNSFFTDRFYAGNNYDTLLNKKEFDRLRFAYKIIHDTYIKRGNLQDANESFVAMKELEGKRLKGEYEKFGGLKNWIGYKLNRLMMFYTAHGTDPAKSIVISIWVVILFAIFYFFFPSDWDVTSKSKLFQNYRDFIHKNEKGYFKPFLALTVGFILSLINALTLSLNAFTTLGFGNIPTHGIARYVCVIQGFIGWFLLSIFTVALINQVLT